jgi:hypothetical protein
VSAAERRQAPAEACTTRRAAGVSRNPLKLWPSLWTFLEEPVELSNNAAEARAESGRAVAVRAVRDQSESGMRYAERSPLIQNSRHPDLDGGCS